MSSDAFGPLELRALMSHWATGVCVVTARDGQAARGTTVNAVTSLSLEPPRLLVCFGHSSRTLTSVRRTGAFAVNVLRAEHEPLSRRFAGTGDDKFRGVAMREAHGVPVLADALAWMVCAVREELSRGDHVVMLAEPLAGHATPDADPLIFFRSGYRRLEGAAPRAAPN